MVYPYLLKTYLVTKLNQVWQIDITYIRVISGLEDAIFRYVVPEIINSDQGSQFTSNAWLSRLQEYNIKISMTGKADQMITLL